MYPADELAVDGLLAAACDEAVLAVAGLAVVVLAADEEAADEEDDDADEDVTLPPR